MTLALELAAIVFEAHHPLDEAVCVFLLPIVDEGGALILGSEGVGGNATALD